MRVNEACDASLMDSRFSWNVLNLSSTDANAFSPPLGQHVHDIRPERGLTLHQNAVAEPSTPG